MMELEEDLVLLESQSQRRRLRVVTQSGGGRVTIDGRSLLNFSSNDYLGLSRHPRVVEAAREVLEHWGAGTGSSRLISGTAIIHQDLEAALAVFLGREAALVFPSGYMANLGLITSLAGPGDAVVMDRLCHASMVDAVRLSGARLLVYGHADPNAAERALQRASGYRRKLLVTESLFSMDGDFAPLVELAQVAKRHGAITLVDDAHAFGVWETRTENWDIVMGTLSKSLGSQGGFVAGSRELVETLINKARSFIFTTGLSPACVAAAQAALSLAQEESGLSERLKKNSARLREGLRALDYDIKGSESQIVPVLMGEALRALACADHLCQNGIYAPAIRPPTVHAGECRLRLSVTAEHTEADISELLGCLRTFPLPSRERATRDP